MGLIYKYQTGNRFGDLRPTSDNTKVVIANLPKKILTKAEQQEAKQYAVKQASRDLQKANEKLAKFQRIKAANKAQAEQGFPTTRQEWADQTQAIGDKMSLQNLPVVGKYIPDLLDVTGDIGNMASSLGSAPLRAQQNDSYTPYITSIGMPLIAGALAGKGAATTGQFVENIASPLPFSVIPNAAERQLIKKSLKAKPESVVPLDGNQSKMLKVIRTAGGGLANKEEEKRLIALVNLKKRTDVIPDKNFEKLTGFPKSEIDNKIDDLKKIIEDKNKNLNNPQEVIRLSDDLRNYLSNINLQNQNLPGRDRINPVGRIPQNELEQYLTSRTDNNIRTDFDNILNSYRNYTAENPLKTPKKNILVSLANKYEDKVLNKMPPTLNENINELVPALFQSNGDVSKKMRDAMLVLENAEKGKSFRTASSLSSDSGPMTIEALSKAYDKGNLNVGFTGFNRMNRMGFVTKAKIHPDIYIREMNEKIQNLNKKLGKNIPFAHMSNDHVMIPDIFVTKKKLGGLIYKK